MQANVLKSQESERFHCRLTPTHRNPLYHENRAPFNTGFLEDSHNISDVSS